MPARRLAFTPSNIMSAWEAVGIIPFNPRRVLGAVKRKAALAGNSTTITNPCNPHSRIPKTPRAVSRATRTAYSLVTRDTPSSQQLKAILSGLSEGFQQTIADKILEEEAHKQYRVLVGKEKKGKTSDRRKLTEATVVTSETILMLRDERDRVDAAKAARQSKKSTRSRPASPNITSLPKPASADPNASAPSPSPLRPTTPTSDADELWEEMEALELDMGMDTGGGGGGVVEAITLLRHH